MKSTKLTKSCRVCLTTDPLVTTVDLFTTKKILSDGAVPLRFIIEEVASFEIEHKKGYPTMLCTPCETRLLDAYQFRERCIKTNAYLKEIFETKKIIDPIVPDVKEIEIGEVKLKPVVSEPVKVTNETSTLKFQTRNKILGPLPESRKITDQFPGKCLCEYCGKWIFRSRFIEHNEVHVGEKKYKCEQCGVLFTTKTLLNLHLVSHSQQEFVCKQCGNKYANQAGLSRHVSMHHRQKRSFQCPICQIGFLRASMMEKHKTTHANEIIKYNCKVCGTGLANRDNLRRHLFDAHEIDTTEGGRKGRKRKLEDEENENTANNNDSTLNEDTARDETEDEVAGQDDNFQEEDFIQEEDTQDDDAMKNNDLCKEEIFIKDDDDS